MSRDTRNSLLLALGGVAVAVGAGKLAQRRRGGRNVGEDEFLEYRVQVGIKSDCPDRFLVDVEAHVPWDGDPDNMPTRAQILAAASGNPGGEYDEGGLLQAAREELYLSRRISDLIHHDKCEPTGIQPQFREERRPVLGGGTVLVIDGQPYPKRRR